ncbi:uncharacterized protein LOC105424404 [Pogonomyrmex barbatus]|uniref:Uncharacterized protein LOC105424404 n=1 Tax=Pogonomyrmex barbatus TaxID=144034 RepID=A0A6I9VX94_9HYME|nr:uncharacterized protein LOC105424404 [Pogonomyrmex barbatus]
MTSCKENEKKMVKESYFISNRGLQEESCLYATNTPNYHNKYVRNEALKRVCATVSIFRLGIVENECTTKFHYLRTQFNIENAKVKSSIKSETGTNDNEELFEIEGFSEMNEE